MSTQAAQPTKTIQAPADVKDAIAKISDENGMTLGPTLAALVACWRRSSGEDQRIAILRRKFHHLDDAVQPEPATA